MRICKTPFLLIVLATFSGCVTVGPNYSRPSVETPPTYKESFGNWKSAQPQDMIPRGRWWSIYGDPQLNALARQVEISNQNVKQFEAQYRQARALVQEARAGFYPTVTGNATTNRTGSANGAVTTHSLMLDASWEPDLWGRIRRSVQANVATAQASAADLANATLSAQSLLVQNYLQLRSDDEQKRMLDRDVAAYTKSLQLTRNQYRAGIVSRADVAQAETLLASTEAQDTDLGVQRSQLEHAIAVLIGRPPAEFSIKPAPLNIKLPAIPVGVPSELLERRPDIAAAERRVATANADIGVAKAALYPSLTLTGSGGFQSTGLAELISAPARVWALGAALAQTLFDGGLRRAQVRASVAAYDATVAEYRQTVLNGFQQVEDELAAARILSTEIRQQQVAVRAAREAERIALNQYRAGIVSYLNVVTAQATELNNERALIQLEGRQFAASALLVAAIGGGWQR